ncbi:MAG TPA: tetratricopeptide repeat protein [Streptosporangiaceae bacterium]|nr:tetratricopeptide repeat protein [Streptosporangiaceae bacterium]
MASTIPATVPALASQEQALAWIRAERANLTACLDDAAGTGQHARIIALTAGLAAVLAGDGPWAEAITRHAAAVRSARYIGDRPGQATALINLGNVRRLAGYPGAARDLEEALGICRDLGDRLGQATTLTDLGIVRQLTGDHPGAARDLEEALGIYRDVGDRSGEVETLNDLVTLHRVRGDLRQARSCHRQALDLARQIGSARDQAHALAGHGRCEIAAGRISTAEGRLRQALEIFQRIGAAEAADVSAELQALTNDRSATQGP